MVAKILIDDADLTDIIYGGTDWAHQTQQSSTFNGTLTTLNAKNQNTTLSPDSFFVYFYGTDFNIYGPGRSGISLNYSLDDSTTPQNGIINQGVGTGQGALIWNIEGLSQTAFHSLKIVPTGGQFAIDYITYTPTQSTTLSGQDLILDDADSSLKYSGIWNKTTSAFPTSVGTPYLGTMTGSNKQGSNMTFTFFGSSVAVFGLLNEQPGKLSVLFSVDGGTTTAYSPFNGTQATNTSAWQLSQRFFHQDVQPGSHTLAVQVQEVTGSQTFWIDSVVYGGTAGTQLDNGSSSGGGGGISGGGIAGVVIAGIVLLFLCGCCSQPSQRRRVAGYITTTTVVYA